MKHFFLASFSAERRIAAVALFQATQLEDIRLRHLPLDIPKALGNVRELVTRTLEDYRPDFLAISRPSDRGGDRILAFCDAVKKIAGRKGIPTLEVDSLRLMHAFGHPPLIRKEHVRRVGRAIWPGLNDAKARHAAVDAATVGLYVQIERLFSLREGTA